MSTERNFFLLILILTGLFVFACDSESPVQTSDAISTIGSKISECDGFEKDAKRSLNEIPFTIDPSRYEDVERLLWLYDENTETLSIMNSRVILNCCGDHEISAANENGVIVISENDQPENGTDRCLCMCAFDFFIEISGLSPGVITLKLVLTVDDNTMTKWQGKIDLSYISGEIIINTDIIDTEPETSQRL